MGSQVSLGTHLLMQISHLCHSLDMEQDYGDPGRRKNSNSGPLVLELEGSPGDEGLGETQWTPEMVQVLSLTADSHC